MRGSISISVFSTSLILRLDILFLKSSFRHVDISISRLSLHLCLCECYRAFTKIEQIDEVFSKPRIMLLPLLFITRFIYLFTFSPSFFLPHFSLSSSLPSTRVRNFSFPTFDCKVINIYAFDRARAFRKNLITIIQKCIFYFTLIFM